MNTNPSEAERISMLETLSPDFAAVKAQEMLAIREQYHDKIIVLCDGVFDVLHPGHIAHLREARSHGDILVVALATDDWVRKGPDRPMFGYKMRESALNELVNLVDYIFPCDAHINNVIPYLKPNIYAKGHDYDQIEPDLVELIIQHGGTPIITQAPIGSSSSYINSQMSVYPEKTQDYLKGFKSDYSVSEVVGWLDALQDMSIVVVGEWIEDIYTRATPLAKSPRDPTVTYQRHESETHQGGIMAVVNHLKGFCDNVVSISQMQVITKERFWDPGRNLKFVGMETIPTPLMDEQEIHDTYFALKVAAMNSQVLMAMDYGHGFFVPKLRELAQSQASFLAVNCQTNSHNYGFNPPTLWARADYICMNALEDRLADSYGYEENWWGVRMVTDGSDGSSLYSPIAIYTPALAVSVVDTVGAGDSLFAISAPLVAAGCPSPIVGFIGNAMAALQCNVVGNSQPVGKKSLQRFIKALMA